MIRVVAHYHNNVVKDVRISGHADFAEHGKDLVCAGVSTLIVGTCNALDILGDSPISVTLDEGYAHITNHGDQHDTQLILETLMISLLTMEESYGQYIQITKKEA